MAEAAIVFFSMAVLIRVLWLLDQATKTGKPVEWGILGYRRFTAREKGKVR